MQASQPSAPQPAPQSHNPRNVAIGLVSLVVLAVALLSGMQLARSNSDIICVKQVTDAGSCGGGSWGAWNTLGQSANAIACTTTYNDQRVYTGVQTTVTGSFTFSANLHTHCNVGVPGGASGTFTTESTACQIVQTRTRVITGTGSGASCVQGNSNLNGNIISDESTTVNTGTIISSSQSTGTYGEYQGFADAQLATSSLQVVPSLVRRGDTARVVWSADRVTSCTVTGSNGDGSGTNATGTWTADAEGRLTNLVSPTGGHVTSAIDQQVIYTLRCVTVGGATLVDTAMVNIIPVAHEL